MNNLMKKQLKKRKIDIKKGYFDISQGQFVFCLEDLKSFMKRMSE